MLHPYTLKPKSRLTFSGNVTCVPHFPRLCAPHHLVFAERVFACAIIGAWPSPVSPPSPVCTPRPLLVHPYCPVHVEGAFACNPIFTWPLPPPPPLARPPPPSPPPLPPSL